MTPLPGNTLRVVYNRQILLNIRHNVPANVYIPNLPEEIVRNTTPQDKDHRHTRRRRGRRSGVLTRLRERASPPSIPVIFLANLQSRENNLDEMHCFIGSRKEFRMCSVFCFTETWLGQNTLESTIQPEGFTVHLSDRTSESTGKTKGGGVCFFINNNWCTAVQTVSKSSSPLLEYFTIKCQPSCLQSEFSSLLLTVVYIPPEAPAAAALDELRATICKQESQHPEAISIIVGDFNRCELNKVLPKYHQHVTCPTRGDLTLDLCYTTFEGAYKSVARPPFGHSDYSSVLLLPAYKGDLVPRDEGSVVLDIRA